MIKETEMKKAVAVFAFLIVGFLFFCDMASAKESNVTFSRPSKDTLVIEGTRMVPGHETDGFYEGSGHPNIKRIVIKEGITGLGNCCFLNRYTYATTIELPQSLRTIGKAAFYGCCSLKRIKIPSGECKKNGIFPARLVQLKGCGQ